MSKQYTYTNTKTGKVIFESVEPNYVSIDEVDKKVVEQTGLDPRLDPFIDCRITVVPGGWRPHHTNNRNGRGKRKTR